MSIETECPSCGRMLKVADSAAGQERDCPGCGQPVEIPEPVYEAELADDAEAAGGAPRRPCPVCGEMIVASAAVCRFCGEVFDESIAGHSRERSAEALAQEKQDSQTSLLLLITGIIGCFSPILAIYGIVFLSKRSHDFPRKGLAIAGTVLHCLWSVFLIYYLSQGGNF
ncbi:MAG: hypothetical protein KY476_06325 [Planctomycetes bacterium]|nr:hypothetical protein [Planctomycetota bacterium]